MSKDLLKRAEVMLKDGYCNEDHEKYEGCGTCDNDMTLVIQELLDKFKGDAERMGSKKLVEEIADNDDFTNAVIDAGNVFPHISPTDMETIAQAAINVIKGDDNDS